MRDEPDPYDPLRSVAFAIGALVDSVDIATEVLRSIAEKLDNLEESVLLVGGHRP